MTDNEIIKALECFKSDECLGAECPYASIEGLCGKPMCEDVYDFIYRQKAEIERLKEYEIAFKKGCALSRCINKGFMQNEAYKEFAERLHQNCEKYPYTLPSVLANIEITYKELTEGGNEDGMDKC